LLPTALDCILTPRRGWHRDAIVALAPSRHRSVPFNEEPGGVSTHRRVTPGPVRPRCDTSFLGRRASSPKRVGRPGASGRCCEHSACVGSHSRPHRPLARRGERPRRACGRTGAPGYGGGAAGHPRQCARRVTADGKPDRAGSGACRRLAFGPGRLARDARPLSPLVQCGH
jgi:hypothetical protein